MGGVVGAITGGGKKKSSPTPTQAPVASEKAAEPKQASVAPGPGAQAKQAITARRGRSQLVSGRSNTATRGGVAIPR